MRGTQSSGAMRCVLLAALAGSLGAHAAVSDAQQPISTKPLSAVANTQASAHRQGAFKASGVNWTCKGVHCSASALPSAVATPLAACRELAREVGAIKSFKVANHALNAKELQQCNSAVHAAAAQPPMAPDLKKHLPATSKADRKAFPYPENWTQPELPAGKSTVFKDMKNELGKKDKTAMTSAKKPPGAKGAPQASAQGDGIAAPQPAPAGTAAPSAPGSRSYPVSIRTEGMTVTGTGPLIDRLAYTRKDIRTEAMTVTGTGRVTADLSFTPKSLRTDGMTVTGTGSLR